MRGDLVDLGRAGCCHLLAWRNGYRRFEDPGRCILWRNRDDLLLALPDPHPGRGQIREAVRSIAPRHTVAGDHRWPGGVFRCSICTMASGRQASAESVEADRLREQDAHGLRYRVLIVIAVDHGERHRNHCGHREVRPRPEIEKPGTCSRCRRMRQRHIAVHVDQRELAGNRRVLPADPARYRRGDLRR
jgi:hypothetical protein